MNNLLKKQFYDNKIGWEKTLETGFCQDNNGNYLPWMCYPAIDYLKESLSSSDIVFEFGSGSSTLFFSKKVSQVVSLESNYDWFLMMKKQISENKISNVDLIYIKDAINNSEYQNYPLKLTKRGITFDIIVIDSIKRFECMKLASDIVKSSGSIVLDDSQRSGYKKIFDYMKNKNFHYIDFNGISPGQIKAKKTSIFKL